MKVYEVIAALRKMNPEAELHVAVKVYTRVYPVAYVSPFDVQTAEGLERLLVCPPEGYKVVKKGGFHPGSV